MDRFHRALSRIIQTLQGRDIIWALTGSASFALQGVPVEVHDIDIQTDAAGAYAIQALFADKIIRPVAFLESPNIRSHLGAVEVEGVVVEIMGAIQKRIRRINEDRTQDEKNAVPDQPGHSCSQLPTPEWEPPVDVGALRIFARWEGYAVPVLPLEYEFGAYVRLGRFERAQLLRAFLREKAERGSIPILCSTGPVARLAGGTWSDAGATIKGVSRLGWPFVELRLWDEWKQPFAEIASEVSQYADILAVHAPPVTEQLLSLPDQHLAHSVIEKCAEVALGAGAKLVVVHAWDLRWGNFDMATLMRNLNDVARRLLDRGLQLSIENIPGHRTLLPDIASSCPDLTFTIDTQWTTLENSWDLVYSLTPRVDNIHVQTYIDVADDNPRLGRVSGGRFEPGEVLREFVTRGFKGLITLEPKNVPENGDAYLTKALVMVKKLSTPENCS